MTKEKAKDAVKKKAKEKQASAIPFARFECPACGNLSAVAYQSFGTGHFYAMDPQGCRGRFIGHDATLHFLARSYRRRTLQLDEDVLPLETLQEQFRRIH